MITITTTIKEVRNGDTFNIHIVVEGQLFEATDSEKAAGVTLKEGTVEVVRKFLDTCVSTGSCKSGFERVKDRP